MILYYCGWLQLCGSNLLYRNSGLREYLATHSLRLYPDILQSGVSIQISCNLMLHSDVLQSDAKSRYLEIWGCI